MHCQTFDFGSSPAIQNGRIGRRNKAHLTTPDQFGKPLDVDPMLLPLFIRYARPIGPDVRVSIEVVQNSSPAPILRPVDLRSDRKGVLSEL